MTRAAERGLSVVEALVMLTATALVAALVLPMTAKGVDDAFGLAGRGLDGEARAGGETRFRRLLQGAAGGLTGGPATLALATDAAACGPAAVSTPVVLRIIAAPRGGRLLCEAGGRATELLAWPAGTGAFAYSPDAVSWSAAWPAGAAAAPLVRFTVRDGRDVRVLWIERTGDPVSEGDAA